MPHSELSPRAFLPPTRKRPVPRHRIPGDGSSLRSPNFYTEVFSPPPTKSTSRTLIPRFRTPTRCKMGALGYEGWQGDRLVTCNVPKLRLSGRWLQACGFAVGDELQVSVGDGVVTISRSGTHAD